MASQPRFPAARPPAPPRRPAGPQRQRPKGGGGGAAGGIFLVLLIAAGMGGAYYLTHRPVETADAPAAEPATVDPVKAEPVKVKDEPKPVEVAKKTTPGPKIEKPEPAKKMEPAPAPTPAPVVTNAPDVSAIFAGTLPLDERAASTPAVKERARAAVDAVLSQNKWDDWSALLSRSIMAVMKNGGAAVASPQGLTALMKSAPFALALEQRAFLSMLTPQAQKAMTADPEQRSFYSWLLTTPSALESWLLTVRTDHDDVAAALQTWSKIARTDPAGKGPLANLALACALVYEKPLKTRWNDDYLTITAEERYAFYAKHAEKGGLALKPDKLAARDLVWVVGAPVPESELEWAQSKAHFRQRTWGTSYDSIRYDMERAVKDVNKYDAYTFAEIQKKGGICGDRAYFGSYTACAVGIPAAVVSGDGSRGPHAWMTWLADDDKWEFSGRYGGYPLGEVHNPQTGKSESEQEFIRRTGRAASDAAMLQGMRPIWLARVIEAGQAVDLAAQVMDGAVTLASKVPAVWQAKLAFWSAHKGEAPLDQWRTFLDALKREMKADPDLLAEARTAEEKFVFPRQDTKLAMKELKKDVRKLDQADGKTAVDQADQIAKVLRQQAEVLKAKGPLDPIRSLYDKSYRDHGRNPAVFKLLAADCWAFVKEDAEIAKKACRDMESAFRRYINSGGDYFDVTSQMSALEVISNCYKAIGEDKKAAALAKDVEKANAKATRQAL